MNTAQLFDKRTDLWRNALERSLSFDAFLAAAKPAHAEKWRRYRDLISLTLQQRELLTSFSRSMNVLVLAGSWCGDCARQCSMIDLIGEVAPSMKVTFIDNEAVPELRDELRIHGAARVPVAVTLSEDLLEVGRSPDRMLAAYRRKAAQELGSACDAGIVPPSPEELAVELNQWVEYFECQHLLLRVSPFLRARHND